MGFDMFHRTALGMTALLAMCARPKPCAKSTKTYGRTGLQSADIAKQVEDSAKREAAILMLLIQRCDELDLQEQSKPKSFFAKGHLTRSPENKSPSERAEEKAQNESVLRVGSGSQVLSHRNRLLSACTHKLLGKGCALHFAASKGKDRLCWQLLAAGSLVGTLNSESATALHLACIAGDLATVKVLLNHGAAVNATTLRGETPLAMAAYNLHKNICQFLLEQGADPSVVSRAEGLSVLHAVAAGVTRQVSFYYRGLSWEGERTAIALSGLSEESEKLGIYTKANSYITQESLVDIRLPGASPVSSGIFLFPETMLERTAKAKDILFVMMKHCHRGLYKQQSRRGLSPADLLLRMWDGFVKKRERILQISDLQLEGQTKDQRISTEGAWEFVRDQIFLLRDMLNPEVSSLLAKQPVSRFDYTPEPEEIQQRHRDRRVSEAPWLFPDLIQPAAPSTGRTLVRRPSVTKEPKAEAPPAAGVSMKVGIIGTGIQFLPESPQPDPPVNPQKEDSLGSALVVAPSAPAERPTVSKDSHESDDPKVASKSSSKKAPPPKPVDSGLRKLPPPEGKGKFSKLRGIDTSRKATPAEQPHVAVAEASLSPEEPEGGDQPMKTKVPPYRPKAPPPKVGKGPPPKTKKASLTSSPP